MSIYLISLSQDAMCIANSSTMGNLLILKFILSWISSQRTRMRYHLASTLHGRYQEHLDNLCPSLSSLPFFKATDDLSNIILVVANLDTNRGQSGYIQLPKERLQLTDKVNIKLHDLITDEHYTWTQDWNFVDLNPHKMPFHLFKLEIHESNM